jgi:hypothetical protein
MADRPIGRSQASHGRIIARDEMIISFRWSAISVRSSKEVFSGRLSPQEDSWMPNKNELEDRKNADSIQKEAEKAHYVGAAILLAAAAGFLLLVFSLNRAFDFSRFAY